MTPTEQYQTDLETGAFHRDAAQCRAVERTQRLFDELLPSHADRGFLHRLLRKKSPVRGLYLRGGTGRGKTYLLDRFYQCLPFEQKHRVHFHRFMRDTHALLQVLPKTPDPLIVIARDLARRFRVLCLDEFHVHDIGDAMIMAGLLQAMFENGITLVATSNTPIEELYQNGLQRDRFVPAITLLQEHTEEVDLGAGTDYRYQAFEQIGTYHLVNGADTRGFLEQHLRRIASCQPKRDRSIEINDRQVRYVALADSTVWFDFDVLCNTPRSAHDYITIAELFQTVLLGTVRRMEEEQDDVAKRFIHLVDALYDHNVKLITTAEAEPKQLYHGRGLAKAFERTVSRLVEMDSKRYLTLPHLTKGGSGRG